MDENAIKVSIIVPVYNVGLYLDMCLSSVHNQTLREIECICVNDGSTDNSSEILDKYKKYDNFIIITTTNRGVSTARNDALKIARGEYIMFLDGDDYLLPEACQKAYEKISSVQSDICVFNFSEQCGNESIFNNSRKRQFDKMAVNPDRLVYTDFLVYIWDKIWSSSFLKNANVLFQEQCVTAEDMIFNWECYLGGAEYSCLNESLYVYRCGTAQQVTNSVDCIANDLISLKCLCNLELYKSIEDDLKLNILSRFLGGALYYLRKYENSKEKRKLYQDSQSLIDYVETLFPVKDLAKIKNYRRLKYYHYLRIIEFIFSIKKSWDRKYKIFTIMGLHFKIKRQ